MQVQCGRIGGMGELADGKGALKIYWSTLPRPDEA